MLYGNSVVLLSDDKREHATFEIFSSAKIHLKSRTGSGLEWGAVAFGTKQFTGKYNLSLFNVKRARQKF